MKQIKAKNKMFASSGNVASRTVLSADLSAELSLEPFLCEEGNT